MNPFPHLLAALRHNYRRIVLAVLNLIITLSVFFTVLIYVKWDFSHNRVWPDSGNIYRLTASNSSFSGMNQRFFPDLDISRIRNYIDDQNTEVTTIGMAETTVALDEGEQSNIAVPLYLVNPNFLDFFQVETIQGDLDHALATPGYIALEERLAKEIFGEDVSSFIDKTLALQGADVTSFDLDAGRQVTEAGGKREFRVAAIYRLPSPITLSTRFRALAFMHDFSASLTSSPSSPLATVWLKTESRQSARRLESTLNEVAVLPAGFDGKSQLSLEALRDIYFNGAVTESPVGNLSKTLAIAFVGLMVLVAGCSNSVSASLTEALEQLRPTGIRKAFGASRSDIFMLNLATQLCVTFIALLPAISIAQMLVEPVAAQLVNFGFGPAEDITISPFDYLAELLIAAFLLSLLNSLFPGVYLARLKPSLLLGNTVIFTGLKGLGLRTVLATFQFAAAVYLIVIAISFAAQLQLTGNRQLGFNANNLIWTGSAPNQDVSEAVLASALRQIPAVQNVSAGSPTPSATDIVYGSEAPRLTRNRNDEAGLSFRSNSVGVNFFATAGIPVIAGREFSAERDDVDSEPVISGDNTLDTMLNEAAVRGLGFNSPEEAIGQVVYEASTFVGQTRHFPRRIIGVAENSAYFQLKRPAETPQSYQLNTVSSPVTRILIRHDGRNEAATRQAIEAAWKETTGLSPLYYSYVDDIVEDSYAAESTTSRLLLVAAFFTVVLSCLGMYALVSTTLNAQSKSIAVRSVFGAVVSHIMALYCARFSKPVLAAMLLGCPAAIWIVLRWIQQFPYQLDKGWIALIACGAAVFVLLLACSVVCVLTARVMHRKPSRVLRYE